ncbi:hypothetical protein CDL12_28317 [Handroanthus impetiginosus]|uniref:Glycosyltransferase n=1 Tax=Handroanthus impetiginosus TaxID=429701 RepID=A0A2G9G1K6_9LAMI|nr:hypothetical protein CDL12_28317 [Handroanthus impetiginosus]
MYANINLNHSNILQVHTMMGHLKNRFDCAVYLLLIFCIVYIFTLDKNEPLLKFEKSHLDLAPSETYNKSDYVDELEEGLAAAASNTNKTVIIAIVNKAYVEGDKPMLDLFLDGFWLGEGTRELVKNLLIVAMDQTSNERCKFLGLHCYKLETEGVDFVGEKVYMSDDFIKMMWRRTLFLGDVLKRGYGFIFTDIDVLWLRNPFPYLTQQQPHPDLQISTDNFGGNQWSEFHLINTGFYMIRSNNKTIALFDAWYANKDNSTGLKEQDVLQKLMHQGLFRKLGLKVRFLDTMYFGGFCQDSRNVGVVATVHANCCRSMAAKLADLTAVVHDWKRYKSSSANETSTFKWSYHKACRNSWRNVKNP